MTIKSLMLIISVLIGNLASGSDFAFGTKVLPGDSDIGRPLLFMPEETSVGYWDTGTPGYDQNDTVYLHLSDSKNNYVSPNDIRLSNFGNLTPGSKVRSMDQDIEKPLTLLPSTINYLNLYGSGAYDLRDPIYLHQIHNNNQKICENGNISTFGGLYAVKGNEKSLDFGFEERLSFRGDGNPFPRTNLIIFSDNYKIMISDQVIDYNPEVVGEFMGSEIEVVHGIKNDYYHVLNTWLMKIVPNWTKQLGFSCSENEVSDEDNLPMEKFIGTNDVRLSSIGNLVAGTKVIDFDPDQGRLISLPAIEHFPRYEGQASNIGYFDANGNGIYDYYDDVYLNFPSGDSKGIVGVNNVRLSGLAARQTLA